MVQSARHSLPCFPPARSFAAPARPRPACSSPPPCTTGSCNPRRSSSCPAVAHKARSPCPSPPPPPRRSPWSPALESSLPPPSAALPSPLAVSRPAPPTPQLCSHPATRQTRSSCTPPPAPPPHIESRPYPSGKALHAHCSCPVRSNEQIVERSGTRTSPCSLRATAIAPASGSSAPQSPSPPANPASPE